MLKVTSFLCSFLAFRATFKICSSDTPHILEPSHRSLVVERLNIRPRLHPKKKKHRIAGTLEARFPGIIKRPIFEDFPEALDTYDPPLLANSLERVSYHLQPSVGILVPVRDPEFKKATFILQLPFGASGDSFLGGYSLFTKEMSVGILMPLKGR